MRTVFREFNVGLYKEHLEETSFLYEQRLAYLRDPEVNWPALRGWEERIEAHIDALTLGGELALAVCRRQAVDGDVGEMHAALRVFCRRNHKDDVLAILDRVDVADEAAIRAASEGLRWELPRDWRDEFLQLAERRRPQLVPIIAQVIGYRRFPCEDFLKQVLSARPAVGHAELAWALGRVGGAEAIPGLRSLLNSDDVRVSVTAAIALLRLGDDLPVKRAMLDPESAWARRVLAIGGNAAAVRLLLKSLSGTAADADAILALGLLGDLSVVWPLVDLLAHPELAPVAGVALNTLTGAALYADVFVPDEPDRDELAPDDRGDEKDSPRGRPLGNRERRPLLDQTGWRTWLEREKHRFDRGLRWRMGRPYGPSALLACLQAPANPIEIRSAAYEELVVRYGLDVPFETELPVLQQTRFLKKIDAWAAAQQGSFVDGRWYFAGQLQS